MCEPASSFDCKHIDSLQTTMRWRGARVSSRPGIMFGCWSASNHSATDTRRYSVPLCARTCAPVCQVWAWFWSYSGFVYVEHSGFSYPCIDDSKSLQYSDHLCAFLPWLLHISAVMFCTIMFRIRWWIVHQVVPEDRIKNQDVMFTCGTHQKTAHM